MGEERNGWSKCICKKEGSRCCCRQHHRHDDDNHKSAASRQSGQELHGQSLSVKTFNDSSEEFVQIKGVYGLAR